MHCAAVIYPATVLKQTRLALKLEGEPQCGLEAQRLGWAELLAHHSEGDGLRAIELLSLGRALDRYLCDLSVETGACYFRIDFEALTRVVGGWKLARLGCLLAGFWPRHVRGEQVWTDVPAWPGTEVLGLATFDDVVWDESQFIPRRGAT